MTKRLTIDESATRNLFILAATTTILAGIAGWMTGNGQLGATTYAASLAIMVIAWVAAFVTLGTLAVVTVIKRCHKHTAHLVEAKVAAQMKDQAAALQENILNAFVRSELDTYMRAVEQRRPGTLHLGIVKNNG